MKNLDSLALKYLNDRILVLDQRSLPWKEAWVESQSPEQMCHIIKTLQVRGAPLIGIAAALALAHFTLSQPDETRIREAASKLLAARPTAVNLKIAMERLVFKATDIRAESIVRGAVAMFEEDKQLCEQMAVHGAQLIEDGDRILTHCNTGSLVTTGSGTALGVIKAAWEQGKKVHVYVDETRPLLQGAGLTAWELNRAGIPHTLICDAMAPTLMAQGKVDKVFVGADRIAFNGDVANKVGTYGVAVAAHYHQVPFYVVAPYTTVDFECPDGQHIPIEERDADEVKGFAGNDSALMWAPEEALAWNPAFDVCPVELITALVLDRGVIDRDQLLCGALNILQKSI